MKIRIKDSVLRVNTFRETPNLVVEYLLRSHAYTHCATSRKVAGSIPDGVIDFFNCLNPSGHTTALRSTQPLTKMSTRINSWGVKAAGALG
jgi:hypothetical protein